MQKMNDLVCRVRLLAFLLCAPALVSGCSVWSYDLGKPLSELDVPATNEQASLGEVLTRLGPPHKIAAGESGYVLAWEYWLVSETSVGLSLGFMGADFLSMDWGDARVKGEYLLVAFDREHELVSSTVSEWDNDAGGGGAIQPLFGFVSVVDVDDLTERMPQHRWGAAALKPLPNALNNPSNPDLGQGGLQQRGTPTGTGQQSLE